MPVRSYFVLKTKICFPPSKILNSKFNLSNTIESRGNLRYRSSLSFKLSNSRIRILSDLVTKQLAVVIRRN